MFSVIVTKDGHDNQYDHAQKKIAQRQFKEYAQPGRASAVTLVHQTRRTDEVLECWEDAR